MTSNPGMSRSIARFGFGAVLIAAALGSVSCRSGGTAAPKPLPPRYETLPPKQLPELLRGTVLERMDHINPDPLQISNFGLVVNLPGTGDGTAPTAVRQYITKEMVRRGFGSVQQPGFEKITPERVLDDPRRRAAIVRVDGFLRPGIRKGDRYDVVVSALSDSGVTSLAGGSLYRTDLKVGGADARNPGTVVEVQGRAEGEIFINPALTLNPQESATDRNAARTSRRQGLILNGGMSDRDQPVVLRLRAPQRSVIRQIQARINQHYQDPSVAEAKDEAILHLRVPSFYNGDWERFLGVVNHLYLDGRPEILTTRAKLLADEAVKPDAPLLNISYAWEAMGAVALPSIIPLMAPGNSDEVQFAAARAAAYIGDPGAMQQLSRMAATPNHRFQVESVRVLGSARQTPAVASLLRRLTDTDSALVRIEAYRALADINSPSVFSIVLPREGQEERFVLDVVEGTRPPIIYATRSGVPRIAIIGRMPRVTLPITFTALDGRLSITSQPGEPGITVFHRPEGAPRPVRVVTRTDLAELIGWLGGAARDPELKIDLTYGEVVAVVQALADEQRLSASDGREFAAVFHLQETSVVADEINSAPPIIPRSRPTGAAPASAPVPSTRPAPEPSAVRR
jgi:HEAT repeat protein